MRLLLLAGWLAGWLRRNKTLTGAFIAALEREAGPAKVSNSKLAAAGL